VADLRASDADRERTVAALRHHAAVGRLSVEELDHRSEQAYAAATLSDLAALQADLPALASSRSGAITRRPARAGALSRRAGTRR
jgi:hypothetical protein